MFYFSLHVTCTGNSSFSLDSSTIITAYCVMKFKNPACWINKVTEVWSEDRPNKVGIDSLKEKFEVKGNCIDLPLH